MKIIICLVITLLLISFVSSDYVPLPYKQTLKKTNLASMVNVNFEIKDSGGDPLENVLIIIQGISNPEFSENKLTNRDGQTSFSLNTNEIFVYIIYKFTYKEETGNFFTNSNIEILRTLNKIPDDEWYFYYENNGEIEVKLKSLDADTNYSPNEYINQILEIRNIAGTNIDLIKDKTFFKTVDSKTLRQIRWWGSIKPYEIIIDLTLKKEGWVKVTIKDDLFEVCVGNAVGSYRGQPFDLSGSEYLCKVEDNYGKPSTNLIPEWILRNIYRLSLGITYIIDGNEKTYNLLTQEFFIDNIDWVPEINSQPPTKIKINEEWNYNITPKYPLNFVYYSLREAPDEMNIDQKIGFLDWIPIKSGNYEIVVRASYPYFYDNDNVTFSEQSFILQVDGDIDAGNIYADKLDLFNKNVKTGDEVKASFVVHNENNKTISFYYKIKISDNKSISYKINNVDAHNKRTIYTSWKYSDSGIYNPLLIIDSKNEVEESNEGDNIMDFEQIEVVD